MVAACIALVAGATFVVLPTSAATLAWTHTVEKTGWEEDYLASADGIVLTEARIEAMGAGMEPPSSAVLEGRWWRYRPALPPLAAVNLANSTFAGGYSLCWKSECQPLASIVPQDERVSIVVADCTAALPQPTAKGR